jgi:hypothetical protein
MGRKVVAIASLLIGIAVQTGAQAQTLEDKLREQLRATLTQLHQVQDDQAALQAQKAQAEQERDALKTQLAAAKAELAHTRGGAEEARSLEGEVSKYKGEVAQAQGAAQQEQGEHDKLQAQLASMQTVLNACEAKNTEAVGVGNDILAAYRDDGPPFGLFSDGFGSFTDVKFENQIQDFEDRLRNAKFDPAKVRPQPEQSPTTNH